MGKITSHLLIIISLVLFLTAQSSCAGNLLSNPGFEDGNYPPDKWEDWSGSESGNPNNGVAGFPAPGEILHSGRKCVGKILYGTGERWGGFSQTLDAAEGRQFIAGGWVMNKKNDVALGRGAEAYIEVKFIDGYENEIKKAKSRSVTGPIGWVHLSVRGPVPSKTKKAVFSFVLTGPKGSRGKVFFDDASLDISE